MACTGIGYPLPYGLWFMVLPVVCLVTLTMPFSEVRKYSVEPGATSQHELIRKGVNVQKKFIMDCPFSATHLIWWTVPICELRRDDESDFFSSTGSLHTPLPASDHLTAFQQILECKTLSLKVLTNEKRGGLRVVSFDRSPFKLLSLKFSNKSANRCRPHPARGLKLHTTQWTLFLLYANNNYFFITLQCRRSMKIHWTKTLAQGNKITYFLHFSVMNFPHMKFFAAFFSDFEIRIKFCIFRNPYRQWKLTFAQVVLVLFISCDVRLPQNWWKNVKRILECVFEFFAASSALYIQYNLL